MNGDVVLGDTLTQNLVFSLLGFFTGAGLGSLLTVWRMSRRRHG
jgi:hypothetical protein